MSKTIIIRGRLQFPSLNKLDRYGKYGATILLDREENAKDIEAVQAAINEIIAQDLGGNPPQAVCLKNGDEKSYDGYAGCEYLSATRPEEDPFLPHQLVDAGAQPVDASRFRAGDYVLASIQIWGQNNKWGRKVNSQLVGLQFMLEGERLKGGGGTDVHFEPLPDVSSLI